MIPRRENLRAFLYLQRVMFDKAERFTQMYQTVVQGDPYLDETHRSPLAQFANRRFEQQAKAAAEDLLRELGQRAGLFYFIGARCEICGQQAWVLNEFKRRYQVPVMVITVDGTQLDQHHLGPARQDQGQAAQMGVQHIPAIVLAAPPETYQVVGQGGGYALNDLRRSHVTRCENPRFDHR